MTSNPPIQPANPSKNVFIDANIIANWLLFSKLIEKQADREVFLAREKQQRVRLYHSHALMEKVVNHELYHSRFLFSPLVEAEVLNVLFEFHVAQYMIDHFISLNDWHKEREKPFPKGTYHKIIGENEKELLRLHGELSYATDDDQTARMAGLLMSEFGCQTHDAFIVATALYNDCPKFITYDKRLAEKLTGKLDGIRFETAEEFIKNQ